MKKIILTILTVTLVVNLTYSQNELIYSFKEKKLVSNEGINNGEEYILKVIDVNSAKMMLKSKPVFSSASLSTPDILKPILGTSLENYYPPKVGYSIYNYDFENGKTDLDSILSKAKRLYSSKKIISDYRVLAKKCINELITIYKNNYEYGNTNIELLIADYSTDIATLITTDDFKKDKENVKLLKEIVNKEIKMQKYVIQIAKTRLKNNPNFDERELHTLYYLESAQENDYANYLDYIINSLTAQEYILSPTFKAQKDIVVLNNSFINSIDRDTIMKESLELYVKNKFVLSFSTGIFGNGLVEKQYYLSTPIDSIDYVFVKEESNSNIDIALGALAHFSYKITKDFQIGLNLGVAVSPFDSHIRYLTGLSGIFGKRNQIILSIGLSSAKMKNLSGKVEYNSNNELIIDKTISEVPTYNKWENSWYIGISYNIFKTK